MPRRSSTLPLSRLPDQRIGPPRTSARREYNAGSLSCVPLILAQMITDDGRQESSHETVSFHREMIFVEKERHGAVPACRRGELRQEIEHLDVACLRIVEEHALRSAETERIVELHGEGKRNHDQRNVQRVALIRDLLEIGQCKIPGGFY